MNFKLINGIFTRSEAYEILSRMIEVKLSFQESKLAELTDEEEIKARKQRIETLRHDLEELETKFEQSEEMVSISATVKY